MVSRRGRFEVIRDVLMAVKETDVKTRIMQKTQLNYTVLEKHLNDLASKGMVEIRELNPKKNQGSPSPSQGEAHSF